MSQHRLAVGLAIFALILLVFPIYAAQGQNYFEYTIHVNSDGSANWKITQFSSANATVEGWDGFQQKIFNLLDSAANVTHRSMDVDENSMQINTTISSLESKTTEYSFTWLNFSKVQGNQLIIGDVFGVPNFFGQLYGDAALQLSYPQTFSVKSVSPAPYEQLDAQHTLRWSRTQDLDNGNVQLVLQGSQNGGNTGSDWQLILPIVAVVLVGALLALFGFYTFKRRKNTPKPASPTDASPFVSEEEKVLKLLKSVGGRMRQSQIAEQTRFSKAKTSMLLAGLEKKGSITRYKSGRDKIVTLNERVKSD